MVSAYSPGLQVSARTKLRRERVLPVPGEILVRPGQRVNIEDVVARTDLPATPVPIRAASLLGLPPAELKSAVTVSEGDPVRSGQVLAEQVSLFGLFRNEVRAPCAGTVETISKITGQIMIRPRPEPLEVKAYLPGVVTEIVGHTGVVIEAEVSQVQGIFGVGGEQMGVLHKVVEGPDQPLDETRILHAHGGAVVLGGGVVTKGGLRRAREVGVKALIAASAHGQDLLELLGGKLNPSATGNEDMGFSLVLTEGFGALSMGPRSFELLARLDGVNVAMNGTTQIRAGVLRPEVISHGLKTESASRHYTARVELGDRVRIVRGRAFGETGIIAEMPKHPQPIGSGGTALVFEVVLDNGNRIIAPRPNIERI